MLHALRVLPYGSRSDLLFNFSIFQFFNSSLPTAVRTVKKNRNRSLVSVIAFHAMARAKRKCFSLSRIREMVHNPTIPQPHTFFCGVVRIKELKVDDAIHWLTSDYIYFKLYIIHMGRYSELPIYPTLFGCGIVGLWDKKRGHGWAFFFILNCVKNLVQLTQKC